jgi:AbrB family looped-hinge helix DNA binding protein
MAKVTSKFQVSIPKTLADQLHIRPGDEIDWRIACGELRIAPADASRPLSRERRLELFDLASQRQAARNKLHRPKRPSSSRGWTRDELYDRGRTR